VGGPLGPLWVRFREPAVNLADTRTKIKFTDTRIAKLDPPTKAGQKDRFYFDAGMPNLAVRVSARSRRFVFQRRAGDGSHYRQTLGVFPALNVIEARKLAKELSVKLDKNIDLRAERAGRKAKRAQSRVGAGYTLGDLIQDWQAARAPKLRRSYIQPTVARLRGVYKPLLDRPAASITPEELEAVWGSLAHVPAAAHAAATATVTVYGWGNKVRKLEVDPTERATLPDKPGDRDNVLSGAEARSVWRAAETMLAAQGTLIQLLLLSGVRRTEAALARWSEFNDDFSVWKIPAARMKMNDEHHVWLPSAMRERLAKLLRFADSDLVFAITGFSNLKVQLDKALDGVEIKPFTFHDFRRTIVTWMDENDVADLFVADRLLAHKARSSLKGVSTTAGIYQRSEFKARRKDALERWAEFLTGGERLESGSNLALLQPAPLNGTIIAPDAPRQPGPLPVTFTELAYAPVPVPRAQEREFRISKKALSLVIKIACDLGDAVKAGILKSKFAPEFKAANPDVTPLEALEFLVGKAAELAVNDETAVKRATAEAEQAKWSERARDYRDAAEIARGSAKRKCTEALEARVEGDEDRALQLESEAAELERQAEGYDSDAALSEQVRQASVKPDDPRVFTYLPGDETDRLATGVLQGMKIWFKEVLGNEHPKWAADFARAATGRAVTPGQGRRRRRQMDDDRRDFLVNLILARLPELAGGELDELLVARKVEPLKSRKQPNVPGRCMRLIFQGALRKLQKTDPIADSAHRDSNRG
jgi:integrase